MMPEYSLAAQWPGYACLTTFLVAYTLVVSEEYTHLRKSLPAMASAGIIWVIISIAYGGNEAGTVQIALRETLVEYVELFLFLLVAMTYVNAMSEWRLFDALRVFLVNRGWSYRQLFWVTGSLAFFLSPMIDNLTTGLVMCAVLLAVGRNHSGFIALGCINIVVAANAGGAFSPFGDITTLMVWQRGLVRFTDFWHLLVPSVVNFVVPAALMHRAIPAGVPDASRENVQLRRGAWGIVILFVLTVLTAVSFHNFLNLPPFLGMMAGLSYLKFYGDWLNRTKPPYPSEGFIGDEMPFDSTRLVEKAEWDTLLFFFGVLFAVAGLAFVGYLELASAASYGKMGTTWANVLVGVLSAIVDNIPVMVAVLEMNPSMDLGQWLLVTLTAGVGGSLLSVGSAAGVALMGQAQGHYTFFRHLRWTPAIGLGYALSVLSHLWLNAELFM